ncbi:MAG: 16S rRNA (guanine(527)-N(7))-methyltransferase RsmG, partial [Alphaproteobacteria bacterium]|nr:16S rRNA (guanine(527)-N(7))-methyltransferase RsmG [Alphaproteobacteria bacterium]
MPLKVNKTLTIQKDVSRETEKVFLEYYKILKQWNESVSLMKTGNWEDFFHRHVMDGLYLNECIASEKEITDIGSGAGVPGIILSILGHKVTMVESCRKKCIFLNFTARALSLDCTIQQERIEKMEVRDERIITARALTSLTNLLQYLENLNGGITGLFLKGEKLEEEITEAENLFDFSYDIYSKNMESGY